MMMPAPPKTGWLALQARELVGTLYLADIGTLTELYQTTGTQVESPFFRGNIVSLDDEGNA
jgi:hypothetical protein